MKDLVKMFYRKKKIKKTLGDMEISESGVVKRLRGDDATLRELRELGIVIDAPVSRVWEKPAGGALPFCLIVGDRRVSLNELLADSVEVTVRRVFSDTSPMPAIEGWRATYLKHAL